MREGRSLVMSREEASSILSEILVTSRTLVELGDLDSEESRFCAALRERRRHLLARLGKSRSKERR